jgi:hypothetical protein
MKKAEIKAKVQEMEGKYLELVWFARNAFRPLKDGEKVCPSVFRVMTTYPEECAELSSENSAWDHGFNSGCLAAFRLMLGLMGTKADAEDAEEWFPELDT